MTKVSGLYALVNGGECFVVDLDFFLSERVADIGVGHTFNVEQTAPMSKLQGDHQRSYCPGQLLPLLEIARVAE